MSDNTTALSKDGKIYDIPTDKVDAAMKSGFEKTFHMTKDGKSYDIPESKLENARKAGFNAPDDSYIGGVKDAYATAQKSTHGAAGLVGGAETALAVGSSVVAPAAGLINAALTKSGGGTSKEVHDAYDQNKENFTYTPKTQSGKDMSNLVGKVAEPVGKLVDLPGHLSEKIGTALGLDPEKTKLMHEIITDALPAVADPLLKAGTSVASKAGEAATGLAKSDKLASAVTDTAIQHGVSQEIADKLGSIVRDSGRDIKKGDTPTEKIAKQVSSVIKDAAKQMGVPEKLANGVVDAVVKPVIKHKLTAMTFGADTKIGRKVISATTSTATNPSVLSIGKYQTQQPSDE